ncbi:hypothetical protein FQN53_004112 [Emmonsiellopsis sp. PD_33]|nr:hypothetical protein FQN53_004112 [Emmonsiellopsis sp. PD_33]
MPRGRPRKQKAVGAGKTPASSPKQPRAARRAQAPEKPASNAPKSKQTTKTTAAKPPKMASAGVRKSAARRPPGRASKKNPWSEEQLTTSSKSRIIDVDLVKLLANPNAWTCLDENEKKEIISLLPDDIQRLVEPSEPSDPNAIIPPLPDSFVRYSNNWRDAVRQFQLDLQSGKYDPEWQRQAAEAMEERAQGEFDRFKEEQFEEFWGQKQKLDHAVIAGESSKVKLETLVKEGVVRVGDVWKYSRVFGKSGVKVLVEKEARIIESNGNLLTFALPPGQRVFLRHDSHPMNGGASSKQDDMVLKTEATDIPTNGTNHAGLTHRSVQQEGNEGKSSQPSSVEAMTETSNPAVPDTITNGHEYTKANTQPTIPDIEATSSSNLDQLPTNPEPSLPSPAAPKVQPDPMNIDTPKTKPLQSIHYPPSTDDSDSELSDAMDVSSPIGWVNEPDYSTTEPTGAVTLGDMLLEAANGSEVEEPEESGVTMAVDDDEAVKAEDEITPRQDTEANKGPEEPEVPMAIDAAEVVKPEEQIPAQQDTEANNDPSINPTPSPEEIPTTNGHHHSTTPEPTLVPEPTITTPEEPKDIIIPSINGPGRLGSRILEIDGRITDPPNGNAWKEFRCYRDNQDMGSLWEVRQGWFVRMKG